MPRFVKLRKDWMLRGWSDVPGALANWTTGDRRDLKKSAFYVAECCDGRTDFDSLAFLPDHLALLDKLIDEGISEACLEGDSIDDRQRYRKADNPRLTGILWCVTGFCNLNCRHCYMESPSGRYGELSFEDLACLIEQFERANVLEVALTGGEPFLRKDLLQILRLLAQKRIRVREIYSNGVLITDEHLESIRTIGSSPVFHISFDGVGGHDFMRGVEGTEQGVIDAIRRVAAAGFTVAVATSIDKLNIGQLAETYELMKRLSIQSWSVGPPREMGNWKGTATATSTDEEAEACASLLDLWLRDGKPFNIRLSAFFKGRRQPRLCVDAPGWKAPMDAPDAPDYTPDSYDCEICRKMACLLPDGTLLPCPGYVDSHLFEQMPNLLRQDLSSVWTQSLVRRLADMKKKDLLARNPECVTCELFKGCGIGCRASALRATGDLMAKDPVFCELWKKGYIKRFQELCGCIAVRD